MGSVPARAERAPAGQTPAPSQPAAPSAAPVLSLAHLESSSLVQVGHTVPSDVPIAAAQSIQLGRARLTPEERHRRIAAAENLYCGQPGHLISGCPVR